MEALDRLTEHLTGSSCKDHETLIPVIAMNGDEILL